MLCSLTAQNMKSRQAKIRGRELNGFTECFSMIEFVAKQRHGRCFSTKMRRLTNGVSCLTLYRVKIVAFVP